MFDADAIQKIADLAVDQTKIVSKNEDEYIYSSRNGLDLITDPQPSPVYVKTLTSLLDFQTTTGLEDVMFHVISPTHVNLCDIKTNTQKKRAHHAKADITDDVRDNFSFGSDLNLEQFIVKIQTGFADTSSRNELISAVSSVSVEESSALVDDGVTQQASSKKGVHLKSMITIPNPVWLKLHKTFGEIEHEQAEEPYIFRIGRSNYKEGAPTFKLYENEAMSWRVSCMELIKRYLRDNGNIPVI